MISVNNRPFLLIYYHFNKSDKGSNVRAAVGLQRVQGTESAGVQCGFVNNEHIAVILNKTQFNDSIAITPYHYTITA